MSSERSRRRKIAKTEATTQNIAIANIDTAATGRGETVVESEARTEDQGRIVRRDRGEMTHQCTRVIRDGTGQGRRKRTQSPVIVIVGDEMMIAITRREAAVELAIKIAIGTQTETEIGGESGTRGMASQSGRIVKKAVIGRATATMIESAIRTGITQAGAEAGVNHLVDSMFSTSRRRTTLSSMPLETPHFRRIIAFGTSCCNCG